MKQWLQESQYRGKNAEVITDEHNSCLVEQYTNPMEYARLVHVLLSQPEFAQWIAENGRNVVEKILHLSIQQKN